ncbi:MAG: EAL domain-containing protein [Gammaproteobacteria bacterium]|nr:EAL domain-containing protein [Gammaproteobacteria bacterium]MBU1408015.1 EAL domain-containing protein [Gammaproteobacteria bacterium]MBU1532578.1 EAL domain-containing protein [Gammaproteobacteria bacterium]
MTSNNTPFFHSIRTRLVIVSILIEVTMLGLLIANSVRLMTDVMEDRTEARLQTVNPLLNASLGARLFERDHASINEILQQLVHSRTAELDYIVVFDDKNVLYAQAGKVDAANLPALDQSIRQSLNDLIYDTSIPITLAGETVGYARYGLSLASFMASRESILRQSLLIAGAEILFTLLALGVAGFLLTRHIRTLLVATRKISGGEYDLHIPVSSRDEIGVLASNFNTMTAAIRNRIAALHRSEHELHEEKERAEVTLHSIGDGVITTDLQGRVRYLNPEAETLTGCTLAEAVGKPIETVYRIQDQSTGNPLANPARLCLAEDTVISGVNLAQLVRADGRAYAVEETAAPIRGKAGKTIGAVLVFHDVTEAREASRKLAYQATHDALTGLINRREFERQIEAALQDAKAHNTDNAFCYMDLDQFKVVNDTCGHIAGDGLLIELATLLRHRVRETDTVARLGGDEFGILMRNIPLNEARALAEDIRNRVRDYRFLWEGQTFEVGISIGVVPIRPDTPAAADIFSKADIACFVAKDKGRNQIHVSSMDDVEQARRHLEMQWSVRIPSALENDRFVLHCQKIYPLDPASGAAPRCELLVRMLDEDGTLILPGRLIPAAERFRHMPDIDRWVIHNALKLIARHGAQMGLAAYAINLSGQSLGQEDLLDFVKREILRSGVKPSLVTFEITETAAIRNVSHAARFMRELKKMGCQFALDDFGSGLSSFGYLKMLPVDYLKIDGSFVRNMVHDEHDHSIVVAITQIAKTLKIGCVAEFVEDEATLLALKEIGVDYAQGNFLHRPEAVSNDTATEKLPLRG